MMPHNWLYYFLKTTCLKKIAVTETGNDHKRPQTTSNQPQTTINHKQTTTNQQQKTSNYQQNEQKLPANNHKWPPLHVKLKI